MALFTSRTKHDLRVEHMRNTAWRSRQGKSVCRSGALPQSVSSKLLNDHTGLFSFRISMAEAIGLATGIISLVSLALKVSQVSYDYVQTVRNSSSAVARYLQEILALTQSLLKLQEALAQPGVSVVVASGQDDELLPKAFIAECYKELDSIKQKLQKRLDTRSSLGVKVQALKWPFQEKDTLEIVEKLSRWNSTCSSVVTACNLFVLHALASEFY